MAIRLVHDKRAPAGPVTAVSFGHPDIVLAAFADGKLAVFRRAQRAAPPAAPRYLGARPPASASASAAAAVKRAAAPEFAWDAATDADAAAAAGSHGGAQIYSLLRSRLPFPRSGGDSESDIKPLRPAWGCICVSGPQKDRKTCSNIFFSFRGGNKIYRTSLPPRSLVSGFFGGAPVEQFAVQREPVSCLALSAAFAPESRWGAPSVLLGTGASDGVAMVWDTAYTAGDRGDHNKLTVAAHAGRAVSDMVFFHGNHIMATASDDVGVRVWRVADGQLLQTLATGEVAVNHLRSRHEGLTLGGDASNSLVIAGTATGSLFCWHLTHESAPGTVHADGEVGGEVGGYSSRLTPGSPTSSLHGASAGAVAGSGSGCTHEMVAVSDHSAHSIVHLATLGKQKLLAVSEEGTVWLFSLSVPEGSRSACLELEDAFRDNMDRVAAIGSWDDVQEPAVAAFMPSDATRLTLLTRKDGGCRAERPQVVV